MCGRRILYRPDAPLAGKTREHNLGIDRTAWTHPRRPVTLVWSEHFERIVDAIEAERRIKGWRREKKEALVHGEWERLPVLASRGVRKDRA